MSEAKLAPQIIDMVDGESLLIKSMDFGEGDDLASGETLSSIDSVTITPTTDPVLTATPNGVSGTVAQVKLSGGVAGTTYIVEIQVVTSEGQKPIGRGRLVLHD